MQPQMRIDLMIPRAAALEGDDVGRGEERGGGFRFLGGLLANLGNRGDDGNKVGHNSR
jgi:hypothetical protein